MLMKFDVFFRVCFIQKIRKPVGIQIGSRDHKTNALSIVID